MADDSGRECPRKNSKVKKERLNDKLPAQGPQLTASQFYPLPPFVPLLFFLLVLNFFAIFQVLLSPDRYAPVLAFTVRVHHTDATLHNGAGRPAG